MGAPEAGADGLRSFDPAQLGFEDLRPRFPAEAALCLSEAATTELGGGFVRLDATMVFDVDYDEAIVVLSGSLTLRRGGQRETAGPGGALLVPAGGQVTYEVDEPTLFFFVRHPRTGPRSTG
jgi:hypothetical protein